MAEVSESHNSSGDQVQVDDTSAIDTSEVLRRIRELRDACTASGTEDDTSDTRQLPVNQESSTASETETTLQNNTNQSQIGEPSSSGATLSEPVSRRPFQASGPPPLGKKKANYDARNKTPISILNEMFAGTCNIRFEDDGCSGPDHSPTFKARCHIRGEVFAGEGSNKQNAKQDAAKKAVDFFMFKERNRNKSFMMNQMRPPRHYRPPRHAYPPQHYAPMYRPPPPPPPHQHFMSPRQRFMPPQYDAYYESDYHFQVPPMRYPPSYGYGDWGHYHHNSYYPQEYVEEEQYEEYEEPPLPEIPPAPLIKPQAAPIPGYVNFGPPPARPQLPTPPVVPSSSAQWTAATTGQKRKAEFTDDSIDDDFIAFDEVAPQQLRGIEDDDEDKYEIRETKLKKRVILKVTTDEESNVVQEHPVSLIHELHPDLVWEFIGTRMSANGKAVDSFKMQISINEQNFTGEGRTKKLAKFAAARAALTELYNILIPEAMPQMQDNAQPGVVSKTRNYIVQAEEPLLLKQDLATRIGMAVLEKSKLVLDTLEETKKWCVLGGIVLTSDLNPDWIDVICVTSGTKCVKGDSLSMLGNAVNDCHAEVLARRCFIRYLYDQINTLIDKGLVDQPDLIVEQREDKYGFRIKKSVKVHLFISTAPCGDGRVFSPKEEQELDNHPNRVSRGLLRAKIEGGEGTIPVKHENSILTWDGILQGQQRLQFMSCSDKISVWNVAGIQGALLSHFLEPVYLESVVIGSLFNFEHLIRAIHGRLNLNFESNALAGLPQTYMLNKAKVAKAAIPAKDVQRQLTKTPSYAVNWMKDDTIAEVLSCDSGKTRKEGDVSRLAKRSFFDQFRRLLGRNVPTLPSCTLGSNIPLIYRDGKTSAESYSRSKAMAIQAFHEQNLGTWLQVPSEMDLFGL